MNMKMKYLHNNLCHHSTRYPCQIKCKVSSDVQQKYLNDINFHTVDASFYLTIRKVKRKKTVHALLLPFQDKINVTVTKLNSTGYLTSEISHSSLIYFIVCHCRRIALNEIKQILEQTLYIFCSFIGILNRTYFFSFDIRTYITFLCINY